MKAIVLLIRRLLGTALLFTIMSCNFEPGSYPYAEKYELNYPEELVKKAIHEFKAEHPEYNVPNVTINNEGSFELPDEQTTNPAFWYLIYFYYKNENKIVFTWTRSSTKENCTFALVAINDGLNIGNWKEINKDFDRAKNSEEKRKFEALILQAITKKLKEY